MSLETKRENCFPCIFHQKWIDLSQTKTRIISRLHIVAYISWAEMLRVSDNL